MRRKPEMVLVILTIMAFVLFGCKNDEITAEEITLEEEVSQEKRESEVQKKEQADSADQGKIWVYVCGQVVYEGKWFTPLREAIQAFIESTQEYVTGEVKFKLYKGNIIKAGTTSPYSLYSESLASFTTGDLYDHHDADGFINLFGLPLKVRAMKMQEVKKETK